MEKRQEIFFFRLFLHQTLPPDTALIEKPGSGPHKIILSIQLQEPDLYFKPLSEEKVVPVHPGDIFPPCLLNTAVQPAGNASVLFALKVKDPGIAPGQLPHLLRCGLMEPSL